MCYCRDQLDLGERKEMDRYVPYNIAQYGTIYQPLRGPVFIDILQTGATCNIQFYLKLVFKQFEYF